MNKPAPFTQNQIKYILKTLDSWLNVAEGGKRGGKNVIQTLSFCMILETHPDKLHLVAGVSQATAKLNVIDCDGYGVMNYFEGRCREGKFKDRACLYVKTKTGEKIILISGGAKAGDEKYIKGNTYGTAYVTEANECHPDFIKEVFDRTISSSNRKIFHDLNPKAPNHWYYTDVLSFHEKKQQSNALYGYNYGHFTIADNLSISDDKLKAVLQTYQKDTVWYERDILGKRKAAEGLIYRLLADKPEDYLIDEKDVPYLHSNDVGEDFGMNKSGHAIVSSGIGADGILYFTHAEYLKATGTKSEDVVEWSINNFDKISLDLESYLTIYPDCAEQTLINSIRAKTKYDVYNSLKFPIVERIRMMNRLLVLKKVKFVKGKTDILVDAMKSAVWDTKAKDDVRLDDFSYNVDIIDAAEYSIEPKFDFLRSI